SEPCSPRAGTSPTVCSPRPPSLSDRGMPRAWRGRCTWSWSSVLLPCSFHAAPTPRLRFSLRRLREVAFPILDSHFIEAMSQIDSLTGPHVSPLGEVHFKHALKVRLAIRGIVV